MPASYTHQCIARAAFQKTQCCIDPHPAAILAGAEGPDPLFFTLLYFGRGTSPSSMGHLLHEERSADFLTALLKGAGQDRLLLSYALGFLTHYAGDTIFHPYIFTRSYDNGHTANTSIFSIPSCIASPAMPWGCPDRWPGSNAFRPRKKMPSRLF